jgi:hypothetical protein
MDGGALDDPHLRRFWARAAAAGGEAGARGEWEGARGAERQVACFEPAACGALDGLRPAQLAVPGRTGRVAAAAADAGWANYTTRNLRRLAAADLPALARRLAAAGGGGGGRRLAIDGAEVDAAAVLAAAAAGGAAGGFCLDGGGGGGDWGGGGEAASGRRRWRACPGADWSRWPGPAPPAGPDGECAAGGACPARGGAGAGAGCCALGRWERAGRLGAGPLRRVFARPWLCVFGTGGGPQERHATLEAAQARGAPPLPPTPPPGLDSADGAEEQTEQKSRGSRGIGHRIPPPDGGGLSAE